MKILKTNNVVDESQLIADTMKHIKRPVQTIEGVPW